MKDYEVMVVVRADYDEDGIQQVLQNIEDNIRRHDGLVRDADEWGVRRLAYEVKGEREGYYTVFKVEADPEKVNAIERYLRLSEDVLRYLITKDEYAEFI